MNFRVVLTTEAARQLLSEGQGAHRTIKYGVERSGSAFKADHEGLLAVTRAEEVPSGQAGRVIEIHGTLSDAAGLRRVVLKHYPVYGGSKGTAIMREA